MTLSEKQLLANRANALKSTGPCTPEGRAAASRNRIIHGLAGATHPVLPTEDAAEFRTFRRELTRSLDPLDPVQELLAGRIIANAWRLRRVVRIERELFIILSAGRQTDGTFEMRYPAKAFLTDGKAGGHAFDKLTRYEIAIHRAFRADLANFLRLRAAVPPPKKAEIEPAPAEILPISTLNGHASKPQDRSGTPRNGFES